MIILGIDTATATASVALVEDGRLICEEVRPAPGASSSLPQRERVNHAEILLPMVDTILSRARLTLSDISAFAVSIGPGSFTGLRIGLATVKGLAYGWDVPAVGVPTLLAVAARINNQEGFICPFLDARKKEVYTALFRKKAERLERLTNDLVSTPERTVESVIRVIGAEPCLFIGDGARAYGDLIRERLGAKCILTLGESLPSTASAVARLAEERIRRQESDPVGPLVPLYLRPAEAELKKKAL